MAKVAIVDDDINLNLLAENFTYRGDEVAIFPSYKTAISNLPQVLSADLIILDVIMPWPDPADKGPLWHQLAGMDIYKQIRSQDPQKPILVFSVISDYAIIEVINSDPCAHFLSKLDSPSLGQVHEHVYRQLGLKTDVPTVFIVHGHNDKLKLELKNYLQNTLGLPEPIILHEQANLGRTIIEKLEAHASVSSHALVLLTPDDKLCAPGENNDTVRRSRQNVIFELGYFFGALGRLSGKVLLLTQGPIDLPTDISGIIYIDVSAGIEAAGEQIRRELPYVHRG